MGEWKISGLRGKLGIGIEVEVDRNKSVVGDETTVCS